MKDSATGPSSPAAPGLLRRTVLYVPAQLLGSLSQLAATVLWTHWLTPEELGVYALVWVAQELLFMAALSWWTFYAIRYMTGFEDEAARARFARTDLVVVTLASVAQALLCSVALAATVAMEVTPALALAATGFALTRALAYHLSEKARARHDTGTYTLLQTTGSVGGLGLGLAAVAFVSPTAIALLHAYAIAQAVGLALVALRTRDVRFGMTDRAILAAAIVYGLPVVAANALNWVTMNALRLVVEHKEGVAAVGLVSVGWWLGQRAASFASVLVITAAFPLAVDEVRREGAGRVLPMLATSGALILALMMPLAAGAFVLAGPFAALFVAPSFRDVTAAVLPLATLLGALYNMRVHFATQSFLLFERPVLTLVVCAFSAVATAVGCWLGLGWGGLVGAVEGCLLAEVATAGLAFAMARRLYGVRLRAGDVARITLATAAMMGALLAVPMGRGLIGLVVHVALGGAVYAAALAALHPGQTGALAASLGARRASR